MYQEFIAEKTAEHLREHIRDYLAEVGAQFTGRDIVPLVAPKSISTTSAVGGIVTELPDTLPAYSVDCANKSFSGVMEDLYIYEYVGQINGLIMSTSRDSAEKLVDRHAAAVELYVRRHAHLHLFSSDNFQITDLAYVQTDFSGAELVQEGDREQWLAAFSIDVLWYVSEDGPSDHA